MRSMLLLVLSGVLLLLPGVSSAETFAECLTQCSKDMSSANSNCPPAGDGERSQCLQDNQDTMKQCINGCPQAAPADPPKDTPTDTPKETSDEPDEH
jgi:hypothetical protein